MAGVYISYPFCAQKCTYCNFASGVFPRDLESKYLETLQSEIASYPWEWRPETVYLGGGTPSAMDPAALAKILAAIPGRPWIEATIEAAPRSLSADKILAWESYGINRVSLGVQSFIGCEIMRIGRKHTAEIVASEISLLRERKIGNINIDLIAGLPGQTRASWEESLDWIERLAPPHVSIYMLEIDEDSRLGNEILLGGKRYGAPDVPPEDLSIELYERAVERLAAIGIRRYEISNFALPGLESKHNLKYWRLHPYAGFGADAHSFDGRSRSQNAETASEYVARFERNETLCVEMTPTRAEEEKFFVGLRLSEGVRPEALEWHRYGEAIHRFVAQGLLEQIDGALRLTDRGVLLSNEVFQEFLSES
ncbi:MAG: coproporphyrinogen III oxidase [Acidobacteria bacterium]|nr:MAG: coproporphyrinogen III oxidase [Acidobacteriota bacterium]